MFELELRLVQHFFCCRHCKNRRQCNSAPRANTSARRASDGSLTGSTSKGRINRYPYYHCPKCRGPKAVRTSKEILETAFVGLLMRLQLKPNYLRLFRAIVADVWKSEQANAQGIEKAAEKRIEVLKAQCDKLDRCFIFDGAIDRTAYERQRDRLRAETTVAELELGDARFDELEVEGVLAFAEHVLGNLVALWTNADAGDRRRIQEALFPTGLVWDGERFGTAVTIPIFNWLPEILGVRMNNLRHR
jgi:hypothetical protein